MEQQQHDALVTALAALSDEDRRAVVRDAGARALATRANFPWSSLRAAIGIVGGTAADAVEDTERLYDG